MAQTDHQFTGNGQLAYYDGRRARIWYCTAPHRCKAVQYTVSGSSSRTDGSSDYVSRTPGRQ